MAQSPLKFFKRVLIHCKKNEKSKRQRILPKATRGLYVLYNEDQSTGAFDVVYIGVGGTNVDGSGIGARIWNHRRPGKRSKWTHFSIFEVHDNVSGAEILELESFLFQIFRRDSRVKLDNVKFGSKAFKKVTKRRLVEIVDDSPVN